MSSILQIKDENGNWIPVPSLTGKKGDKGDTGAPGADGVSCTHEWDGTTLIITSASGTSSADLKGDNGSLDNIIFSKEDLQEGVSELPEGALYFVYTEPGGDVEITEINIEDYFTVSNGSYYFKGNNGVFTSNNGGVNNGTATTTLTAKKAMTVSFGYSYSSESNYDKFTLTIAGTTVESEVSGATTKKSWSGSLAAGKSIVFTYAKDSSKDDNDDKCTFYNMIVCVDASGVDTTKSVAMRITKMYVGAKMSGT